MVLYSSCYWGLLCDLRLPDDELLHWLLLHAKFHPSHNKSSQLYLKTKAPCSALHNSTPEGDSFVCIIARASERAIERGKGWGRGGAEQGNGMYNLSSRGKGPLLAFPESSGQTDRRWQERALSACQASSLGALIVFSVYSPLIIFCAFTYLQNRQRDNGLGAAVIRKQQAGEGLLYDMDSLRTAEWTTDWSCWGRFARAIARTHQAQADRSLCHMKSPRTRQLLLHRIKIHRTWPWLDTQQTCLSINACNLRKEQIIRLSHMDCIEWKRQPSNAS